MIDLQAAADALYQQQQRDEQVRRAVLIEAYWKLRDHAEALRETKNYRQLCERRDDAVLASERPDRHRYFKHQLSVLEFRIRGIEDGARDLAKMLGTPEHEIERPVGSSEVTDGR